MASERPLVRTRAVLASGLLAALSACVSGDLTESPGQASLAPPPLRLYVFDCGYAPVHELELFSLSIEEVAVPELFVPCYLIEHSGGRLLWEAGVPARVADSPQGMELYGFFTKLDRTLADQLDGDLVDERGSKLSIQRERYLREEVVQFQHHLK